MKRRFEDYTRLARGIFGVSSLWLGPRDVLYVHGAGVLVPFSEEYLRFDLGRIQSAAIVKTRTGLVLNIVFGTLAVVFGILGGVTLWQAASESQGLEPVFFYVLATPLLFLSFIALVLFLINVALGPTCRFQLQTATRIERVRPLRRLRAAHRVLAQLQPVLAAAAAGPPPSIDPPQPPPEPTQT